MAVIKPFKGMRYNTAIAGSIEKLCCPPYDIIDEQKRKKYIDENEYNIVRLELPKEGENPYKAASKILDIWKEKGILFIENKPAFYIYEDVFSAYGERKSVKGLIARVRLEEFSKGVILPHEFTLSKAKQDRLKLIKATNCNFSQIYVLYRDETHSTLKMINEQSSGKASLEFIDEDNVTHRLWIVTDENVISGLISDFANRKLYIADGHHRYETALNYRNYCRENGTAKWGDSCDFQMMSLVDMEHPGLVVFPTHRLVKGLKNFNKNIVLKNCSKYFNITKNQCVLNMEAVLKKCYDNEKIAFGFYCGKDEWYLLELKNINIMDTILPNLSKAFRQLDVTVLHTLVFEKIFGIDKINMENQVNLTYTKNFDEAISAVNSGECNCSFVLNPTRITQIRDISTVGEKMPQKSTYFYPKIITGMVMNDLSVD